jgi:SRSO17 transposase
VDWVVRGPFGNLMVSFDTEQILLPDGRARMSSEQGLSSRPSPMPKLRFGSKASGDTARALLETLFEGLGRRERRQAIETYVVGLLLCPERRTVERIAQYLAGNGEAGNAMRQRMQRALALADWDESIVYARLARHVLTGAGPGVYVIGDCAVRKRGEHSPAVARQYSGTRLENCQMATTLQLVVGAKAACVGAQLFMPKKWAADSARRDECQVPATVTFRERWQLGLELLERAASWKLGVGTVVAGSDYGRCPQFRAGVAALGFDYVVLIPANAPLSLAPLNVTTNHSSERLCSAAAVTSAETLALGLPALERRCSVAREVEGSFRWARVRAHDRLAGSAELAAQWLLSETSGNGTTARFWLSSFPQATPLYHLLGLIDANDFAKAGQHVMRSELGLDDFSGRSWRGFHHHLACVAAAQVCRGFASDRSGHAHSANAAVQSTEQVIAAHANEHEALA